MNTSVINFDELAQTMLYSPKWNPPTTGFPLYDLPETEKDYYNLVDIKGYSYIAIKKHTNIDVFLIKHEHLQFHFIAGDLMENIVKDIDNPTVILNTTIEHMMDMKLSAFDILPAACLFTKGHLYMLTTAGMLYIKQTNLGNYDAFLEY